MTKQPLPSPELLRKLLRYEPETGKLFWRKRTVDMFATVRAFKTWNTRFAGVEAICGKNTYGYKQGRLLNKTYRAHRVIWAMETGSWPSEDIDHIDGNKGRNLMENLRDVPARCNAQNQSIYINNTSGVIGVGRHSGSSKWRARIRVDGVLIGLGHFANIEDAIKARSAANIKYGFHAGHGREAR